MIKSMTGFSRQLVEIGSEVMSLEIKGVNNRYLDIGIKMPEEFNFMEEAMKSLIRNEVKRGRVDVRLKWKNSFSSAGQEINKDLLTQLLEQAKVISKELHINHPTSIESFLTIPGVVGDKKTEMEESVIKEAILDSLSKALEELNSMRFDEGQRLKEDIEYRLELMEKFIENIKEYQHLVVEEYRDRLQQRVNKLKVEGLEFDDNRLLAEIALFAEKCNITEEIVRFQSHIKEFKLTLDNKQSVGRKLDFLLQEINREINTIGSKSNNYQIAKLVVELKGETEKIREQVQNIE